ncbi:MAG: hypothetical protein DWQ47_00145 [Acidobacteria bacterium]|nr:MAG: hypothetical protein DWQ32_10605 [Acidobacteriota bacterium]REK04211.1 MAG: hypothetical protein DWQ38_00130 [Acidobacteriota bacterium]REK15472.1 MAG: hypothetical protein DWQ43_16295 [Acidobacteriota bacterium]REK46463.1 MAG: hypothetical protein DWQ47_00145 [Acidobacteriota bacterium]
MIKKIGYAAAALAVMAVPALAQGGAADNQQTVESSQAISVGMAVLGFGIAAGLAAIGQGLVGSKGAEGAARNPGAAGTVQTLMIIALALIESLVLFALLIVFTKV